MSGKREPGISICPTVKLNLVNDAVCGGASSQGTGATLYGGILGIEVELTDTQVYYDSDVGTLLGGRYQYVQINANGTASPARGLAAFWDDPDTWLVSADAGDGNFAGVFLNAVDLGHFGWIQKSGKATCLFAVGQTPAVKLIVCTTSGANTFDALADGTAITTTNLKLWVGRCKELADKDNFGVVELLPGIMDTPF